MTKIGRDRKGFQYQSKRKTLWKPVQPAGEVRYQVVRKTSNAGVEYITYKPLTFYEKGSWVGKNRKERRADMKWEKGTAVRMKKKAAKDAHELGKITKMKRIKKQHEENHKRAIDRKIYGN